MPEMRQLTTAEIDKSLDLSEFAFQYKLSPAERESKRARTKAEHVWGCFEDGHLASKMTILPLESVIQGKTFAMGGIASVATWPEYRHNGFVKRLLTHGLRVMKEAGQTISYLVPFSFAYYRKYGWEYITDYKKYTINVHQLPRHLATSGTIVRKSKADYSILKPIYDAYALRYNGMLKRSDDWWQHNVLRGEKTIAVYFDVTQKPRGYMLYTVKNEEMAIDELIALDEDARRGLWQFISHHDSMVMKVCLEAASDDLLPFWLPEPRIKQEVVPHFMGRIVDVAAFIAQYPFNAIGKVSNLTLNVDDPCAPWNDAVFSIAIDECGKAHVVRVTGQEEGNPKENNALDGAKSERDAQLHTSIQALTALLLGDRRADDLYETGRLHGDAEAVQCLAQLVPHKTSYCMDSY